MFAAVLDTCVVYSGLRRDLLLTMSAQGVFRVVLSEDLLFEIQYVEAGKLRKLGASESEAERRADRLVAHLRDAFEVLDPRRVELVGEVGLPDPDDEHVVATGLAGDADVIVTDNLKDFPDERLPDGLRVQRPKDFLHDMVTANLYDAMQALHEMAARRQDPPQGATDILDLLIVKGLASGETTDLLKHALERWGSKT